jgi:hypothetical protein
MRDLHAPVNAADHQALFAPVKLERLTQIELQRHEGFDIFASAGTPGSDEVGDAGVATAITAGLDLRKQRLARAPVLFVAAGIGFEGLL